MNTKTLYVHHEELAERLTVGLLRQYITQKNPLWISLEPRAWLPERNGRRLSGRLPGLEPLTHNLPEGLDDLPVLAASLYAQNHWQHFHDAHPLSQLPSRCITWSLAPPEDKDSQPLEVLYQRQQVLRWHDRQRFGLPAQSTLPPALETEHYYQNGKRLAWRLIPMQAEVSL